MSTGGASVSADIVINGDTWRFSAELSKDRHTDQMIVTEDFFGNEDDLGLNIFPNLTVEIVDADHDGSVDDAVVNIPKIDGVVMIDGSEFNSKVDFTYGMKAELRMTDMNGMNTTGLAGITDPFALGTPDDGTDDLPNFDDRGVEFFLDGQPLSNFPIVPEPTAAALLALGGLALIPRSRRSG